jgi:hypothetical protein
MDIRKTCPAAVNGLLSRVSRTQPVPSTAACFAGSARTAKMASAGALMTVVALTVSSAMSLPPDELSLAPVLAFTKPGLIADVAAARIAALLSVAAGASRAQDGRAQDGRDKPRNGDLSQRGYECATMLASATSAGSSPGVTWLGDAGPGLLQPPR